jgi:malate dehydrogenase (oxaloacetate-decarboxylating)
MHGLALLSNPLLNKDTAFSEEERDLLGLRGLLPSRVTTIEDQVALELEHVRRKRDDLERYIGLAALHDRNETLFYRLLVENLEEFLPIVYTPTVGRACQAFSHILRRPRGVWITPADIDRIDDILRVGAPEPVRLVVVTDNERILGLGDQGAGGILIPVGKLALYTAAAGIHPSATLPVSLDVGTDQTELLEDPLYLGYRAPRLRDAAYDEVVDAFVASVARVCPAAIVQWEDFKQHNAVRILARYRDRIPSFNDDIQGTGAVVIAGLLAARRRGSLLGERFLFLGAGAAALGIAGLVCRELEAEGASPAEARAAIAMCDRTGLVHLGRSGLPDDQRQFAADPSTFARAGLTSEELSDPVAVARALGATVLVGATGCAGAFTEGLVRTIAANDPNPIILPLSNPGSCAEARPEDILAWTDDRAIVATGSPNEDVATPGGRRVIGQANNVFVFPGVGLGAIVAGATKLTDDAFLVAARALAGLVSEQRLGVGAIYPPVDQLRLVARTVAVAVARHLLERGAATGARDHVPDADVERSVDDAMWWPAYRRYVAE